MDKHFLYFLTKMGSSFGRREVPPSSIDKYTNVLPKKLLEYWSEHGWAGYGKGIFWTVNPAEYNAVIHPWLEASGFPDAYDYHVIARGAFGNFYLWKQHTGNMLDINIRYARYLMSSQRFSSEDLDKEIKIFFSSMNPENNNFDDLFDQAFQKLGPLQPDEMYGFVPAIALGGPGTLNTLQKVKIIEHLTFLSQLSPLTDWGFPNINDL